MTVQIAVRLPEELVAALDEVVRGGQGPSTRTEGVRIALEAYLRARRRREVDESIKRGYMSRAITGPDEWGDLDSQTDANVAQVLARLERDELDLGSDSS